MKFECDSCHAQYMIADEKVGKRGVKVKCKKCQHVIIVRPEKGAAAAAPAELPDENKTEALKAFEKPVPVVEKPAEKAAVKADKAEKAEKAEKPEKPEKAEKAEKKARHIEVPQPTLAQPPPPGLDLTGVAESNDGGGDIFASGGPTDPGVSALNARRDAPPTDDLDPETTGPGQHRPAPVSLFGDATQLTQNPMQGVPSEEDAPRRKKGNDATELAAPPQMEQVEEPKAAKPEKAEKGRARVDATIVTKRMDDDVPAPPPPPPSMAAPGPVPAMTAAPSDENALDDQLAGAFNSMFDAASAQSMKSDEEDQRGPTRVLDVGAMDALRKQTAQPSTRPDPNVLEDGLIRVDRPGGGPSNPAGADDGPAEQVWHVAIDDQDVGPLSVAEVGRHIEGGRVDRESLVWKVGMDDWLPAGDVPTVRALFDKVPMPRIARVDDEPRSRSRSPSFDTGPTIDDEAAPFPGKGAPSGGPSPFDESADDDDSWRPHGLTDVYQAANLAEAAGMGALGSIGGGGGGPPMASAKPAMSAMSASSSSSSNSEPEWRPAAASALASLVQDEIKRIDNGPLPAADDDLSPADDASINAPVFGSLGMGADLESGPDVGDPVGRVQSQSRPPQQSFDRPAASPSYPPQGFATAPPEQSKLTPQTMMMIGGAVLVVIVVLILAIVLATRSGSDPKIFLIEGKPYIMGPDNKPIPVGGNAPVDTKPVETTTKPTGDKLAMADTKAPESGTATHDQGTGGGEHTASAGGLDAKAPDSATPEKKTAPDDGDKPAVEKAAPKPHVTAAASTPKPHVEAKPKEEDKPKKPDLQADKPTPKGCDPVLDFDCGKKGGGDKPPPSSEPVKDSLSKSDVLLAVKANMSSVEACGRKNKASGVIKMSWKVQPNGKTSEVSVADSKFAGTPVGTCVQGAIKSWKFPASKVTTPVTFPMKLD